MASGAIIPGNMPGSAKAAFCCASPRLHGSRLPLQQLTGSLTDISSLSSRSWLLLQAASNQPGKGSLSMRMSAHVCTCWGYSAVLAAFSAAGVGLSTKLSSRPSSPRPAAIRNMVPQVAGTRYRSAGCPMCVMALAAKAMPRPPMYAACMHAATCFTSAQAHIMWVL